MVLQMHSLFYLPEQYKNFPWKKDTKLSIPTEELYQIEDPHAFN